MTGGLLVASAILSLGLEAAEPGEEAFQGAYESITGADLARHIEVLASDDFEGREPGTPGEEKTVQYLRREFRRAGARPGVGRSYFQNVPLIEMKREGTPLLTVAKGTDAESFAFETDFAAFAGGAVNTVSIENAGLVFVGYGIDAPEQNWNDYEGIDVTGKIVVMRRGEPERAGDGSFFDGMALTRHGMTFTKYDTAAAHGARGAIVIHTDESAGFPWSVYTGGGIGSAQNFIDDRDGKPKLDVVIHVNEAAATRLMARAGLDLPKAMTDAGQEGFEPVDLGLTVDAAYRARERRFSSHNVIARIEGREAPDECVVYTAHWDHVGINPDLEGDQIFNSAVDNATGTAGLIELAEAYAALPERPRRSIYFIATAAEEKGLLGADYYAGNPVCPLAKTVAVINMDALFPFGPFAAMTVTGFGSNEVETVLAVAARRLGRILQDDGNPQAGAYYRSDHYPFAKRGVPAIFAVGGPVLEGLQPDDPIVGKFIDYVTNKYHKVADEYDPETWDMRGIEEDIRIFFETGYRLADDTRFPNWTYGNQFRAMRDEMLRQNLEYDPVR